MDQRRINILTRILMRLIALSTMVLLTLAALPAAADSELRLGIMAFRPNEQAMERWQRLASYLESRLNRPVVLTTYDYERLGAAVNTKSVDVVLTNPAYLSLLRSRNELSAPIATTILKEGANELKAFGGVIFVRSGNTRINSLADVSGKRIATNSMASYGGYQMQAFEMMQAGLSPPDKSRLLITGMPHDKAVTAVLKGLADVGFVRSGVLEAMAAEGKLDLRQLKIINRQTLPDYPFLSSTQLFPEWPVIVLPQVDEHTARRLAIALFSLKPDDPAALTAGIHGFAIPSDYTIVDRMLRQLRLPPYDATPDFTLKDIWDQYAAWATLLVVMLLLLLGMLFRMLELNRKLKKSSDLLLNLSSNLPGIVYQYRLYPDGHVSFPFVSDAVHDMFGLLPEQLREDATLIAALRHPDDTDRVSASIQESARTMQMWHEEYRVVLPGQQVRWLRGDARPERLDDGSVLWHGYLSDVTERKELEEKLQRSEEHFRFVSESANAMIWMSGVDKLCIWFNKVWLDFTGRTLEQEQGNGWVEGVHPDDVSRSWEIYSANFDQRKRFEMEYRLKRRDGEYRWLQDIGTPYFDSSGNFEGYIGSCFDITDRKFAELALQMTQFSVMHSADAVFWMNSEGRIQFVNEAACQALGYSRDELLRLSVPDLDIHHSVDVYDSTWKELKIKKSLVFESVHRAKDGRLIPVEITANYHEYEGQEFNCAFVRDITDRKQAEGKLRESHQVLEGILGTTLDGYWCVDEQGNLLDVNQAYCRISGYTRDELLDMKIVDLQAALDASGIENRFENRIRYSFRYGSDQFETLHRRKNGSTWNVEVSVTYRNISGGRLFVFMRDITERKRMQEELQQIATTDDLTGLINRRHFMELAHNELRRAVRLRHPLSIALIDIDHFKQVNDTHGHAAGDYVLQVLAQTVKKNIREIDVFARLGGDEFVLLLPGASGEQAFEVVERARQALVAQPVSLGDEIIAITISSGIASISNSDGSFNEFMGRADRALYRSKGEGRNIVTVE